jgi:hypothetical protein
MKEELKIALEEIAELRREGENARHWLYGFARNYFSANPKEDNISQFRRFKSRFWPRFKSPSKLETGNSRSLPGKKTAREESHGAHKETDAEKAGGSIAKPTESVAENSE